MKYPNFRTIGVLALFAGVVFQAQAGDLKVIANPSVKASALSADELSSVFLASRNSLGDGSHVEPVILKSGATHEAFLKEYVHKNSDAFAMYLRNQVFTGKGTFPKSFTNEGDVASYVAKTKGAIGYVNAATETPEVKVIAVK